MILKYTKQKSVFMHIHSRDNSFSQAFFFIIGYPRIQTVSVDVDDVDVATFVCLKQPELCEFGEFLLIRYITTYNNNNF